MSQTEAPAAATPAVPPDPIVHKSYSVPIAIAMLVVVGATVLAVVDEMWLRRPYKAIQGQFRETYSAYLAKVEAKRRDFYDNVLLKLDEYTARDAAVAAASAACADATGTAQANLTTVTQQSRALAAALKVSKSELSALAYQAEDKAHAAGHDKVTDAPEAGSALEKIRARNDRSVTYTWPVSAYDGRTDKGAAKFSAKDTTETGKVADLLVKALDLESEKARLQQVLGDAGKPKSDAAKAKDEWLAANLGNLKYVLENTDDATRRRIADAGLDEYLDHEAVTLSPAALAGIRTKVEEIPSGALAAIRGDIDQIHIADAGNWVDRCVTCHVNARAPMAVTVQSMRSVLGQTVGDLPAWNAATIASMPLALFASHPSEQLLKKHDPDRFGCSMCHNGNGVALTTTRLAHGENEDWLMPLFPRQNVEAGCVQCHQQDLVLEMGERINAGRDAFRRNGCWGCHKYEGFNKELDQITALNGRMKDLDDATKAKAQRSGNLDEINRALNALDDDSLAAVKKLDGAVKLRDQQALTQEISGLVTERAQVVKRLRETYVERQRVGPNLKDVKVKILGEFLTDWVKNPREAHQAFRSGTKMPVFRWSGDEEVKDAAAFIWQSALDPAEFPEYKLPAFTPGDAKKGEELFTQRGCLACHAMGSGDSLLGNDYAANLSNLGEKDDPKYVARWVNHPRARLVAYDPAKKPYERDVSGKKYDDRDAEPNLVWTQHAIMPNFRLNDAEVRDITTYLVSQRRSDVQYEAAPWLDDKSRVERGRRIVLYQGCAGCHEIRGLEDEKGIGVELTEEGSKPIERLDFGHLTIAAERSVEPLKGVKLLEDAGKLFEKDEEWYRPRGFILHKLAKPDIYDSSKYLPDRLSALRMPQFKFTAQKILDVTTFVLGSVATKIPQSFRYTPDAAGQAIREGWWVVKKYNCQACHQINPADEPAIWKVPYIADAIAAQKRDQAAPPSLVGVGFRLRPEWMAKFLRDPSLGGGRERPASVRAHLAVRMPTFDFSEDEIRKLVLFFGALAKQPSVYQPPEVKPLTDAEHKAATAIYNATASCVLCHVVNGAPITSETKAPNFSYAPERLRPEWVHRWVTNPPLMMPATAMAQQFGIEPGPDGKWHYGTSDAALLKLLQSIPTDNADLMARYVLTGLAGK